MANSSKKWLIPRIRPEESAISKSPLSAVEAVATQRKLFYYVN
jgi:hypothetical protein